LHGGGASCVFSACFRTSSLIKSCAHLGPLLLGRRLHYRRLVYLRVSNLNQVLLAVPSDLIINFFLEERQFDNAVLVTSWVSLFFTLGVQDGSFIEAASVIRLIALIP